MSDEHKPQHIAIITDGNRRWATERGLPKFVGHTEGAKNLKTLALSAIEAQIPYLTLWGMSTENLKRDAEEISHLFSIFAKIVDYLSDFDEHQVRFNVIGDTTRLPNDIQTKIKSVQEKTRHYSQLVLTIALVYGGRDEIVRATRKIIEAGIHPDDIDEEIFGQFLDTANLPDVDLLIRTGGNKRLSGYLPWQSTYAEIYFTDTYFPAFGKKELNTAIKWFGEQKRNFGK